MSRGTGKRLGTWVALFLSVMITLIAFISGTPTVASADEGETIDIPVSVVWNDNDNEFNSRPESLHVKLMYSIRLSLLESQNITVSEVDLDASNGWEGVFTDIPKFDENGEEYRYYVIGDWPKREYDTTWANTSSPGFTPTLPTYNRRAAGDTTDGFTITYTPSAATFDFKFEWHDEEDSADRPSEITFDLMANGEKIDEITLTVDDLSTHFSESRGVVWNKFVYGYENDLKYPLFGKDGELIVYTIRVQNPAGYVSTNVVPNLDSKNACWNLTAKGFPAELLTIPFQKVWEDDGDESLRPEAITVQLYANDEDTPMETKEVTTEDGWRGEFIDLPAEIDGEPVLYTVVEVPVDDYTSDAYEGIAFEGGEVVITNTYVEPEPVPEPVPEPEPEPVYETRDLAITKIWNDENDKQKMRPESITVRLLADGEVVDTVKVEKSSDWKCQITGIAKNDEYGNEIVYTIEEEDVRGYLAKIDGDADEGFKITNTCTANTSTDPRRSDGPTQLPQLGDATAFAATLATALTAVAGLVISRRLKR